MNDKGDDEMSREIKLQIWDARYKRFLNKDDYCADTILLNCNGELVQFDFTEITDSIVGVIPIPFKERYTSRQYTGLKDMNGKEIYEGDITSDDSHLRPYKMYVYWHDKVGEWRLKSVKSAYSKKLTQSEASFHEIIGNIYENPELKGGRDART